MKKVLVLLLSLICVLSLTFMGIGCKEEAAEEAAPAEEAAEEAAPAEEEAVPEEMVTISMCVFGMPWENLLYTDILIPIFEERNPNVKVDFALFEDYSSKLVMLAAGGEVPDVVREGVGYLGRHAGAGMLKPLDDFINGPKGVDMTQYTPGYFDSVDYLDGTYMMPVGVNNITVVCYNLDLFDAEGIEYPSNDWFIEEFEEAAKNLSSGDVAGVYWENASNVLMTLLKTTGAEIWNDTMDEFIYDEEVVEAVEILQRWIYDDQITPPELITGESVESALLLFQSGRLGMFICGGYLIPSIIFNSPDLNFGVVPFPASDVKTPGGYANGTGWSMSNDTKYPDEAWELVKLLSSEEGILKYWQHTYVETVALIPVLEHPDYKNILGMEGNVLPITDEEEFNQKLGFHTVILENGWFFMDVLGPYYYAYKESSMTVLEETTGVKRGDATISAQKMVDAINRTIEQSK